MKNYLRSGLTLLAVVVAAAGGYIVGTHSTAKQDKITFRPSHAGFVKRVVGIPGDRVEVRNGTVFVNGNPLDEPYK